LAILLATTLALGACSREQPSAMPATAPTPSPAAPVANVPPAETAPVAPAAPAATSERIEPPEFDEQVAPLAATGFAVCDEYFERARTCINTRLSPEDRKVRGTELRNSARLIGNSAQGDVNLARIEHTCKRLRAVGTRTLSKHGCTDL
jgi:Cu-Zn family superoxide dismutase